MEYNIISEDIQRGKRALVSFLFSKGGGAMKSTISCPYPTVCEYDAFRKTGKHFCERVVCPYAFSIARLMEWRRDYLRSLSQGDKEKEERGCLNATHS